MNEIDEYIRTNRERYTRAALDEKLRAAGHDEATIDAAWERVNGATNGSHGRSAPPSTGARLGTIALILLVIGAYAFIGLYGLIGIGFTVTYAPSSSDVAQGAAGILTIVYVGAMLVGLGLSIRSLWRSPRVSGTGAAVVGALGISFVLLAGITGACFVITSAVGSAT